MSDAALSADAVISFIVAAIVLLQTLLSVIHELSAPLSTTPLGSRIVKRSEEARTRLFSAIERGYQLRFVSLFVLFALFVSTVSPVSTLIELEDSIISRSCENLQSAKVLAEHSSAAACAEAAKRSGLSFVEAKFGDTQNHLLQIAMWPLVAAIYGFMIAGYFRFFRKYDEEPLRDIIERAPHVFHIIQATLVGMAVVAGLLQNAIGT